ncbi:hypothetical protein R6Q57_013461 [Mikania cordata]
MAYHVQNHSLDIMVPEQENSEDALLLDIDSNASQHAHSYDSKSMDIMIGNYKFKVDSEVVHRALKGGIQEKIELAIKFGIKNVGVWEIRGDPAYVRASCEASLQRLEIDCIDLYYQHRIDTRVPIEITVILQLLKRSLL